MPLLPEMKHRTWPLIGLTLIYISISTFTSAQECGGKEAVQGSWPWQAHLIYKSEECYFVDGSEVCDDILGLCGASIINENWLVTAAHCIADDLKPSKYTIRVGQHIYTDVPEAPAISHTIRRMIVNPSYNELMKNNDIALLQVDTPIKFSNIVGPVCLPAAGSDPVGGRTCMVTGWGDTKPTTPEPRRSASADGRTKSLHFQSTSFKETNKQTKVLRQVELNVVERSRCNQRDYYNQRITEAMICAGTADKDACQGDSGGPFVCQNNNESYVLEGVVSWGTGCGVQNKPGVYVRVGLFIPWINETLLADLNSARPMSGPVFTIFVTFLISFFLL